MHAAASVASCTAASVQDPGQGSREQAASHVACLCPTSELEVRLRVKALCVPLTQALAPAGWSLLAPALQDKSHSYPRVSTAGSRINVEPSGATFSYKTELLSPCQENAVTCSADGFCGNPPLLSPDYSKATMLTLDPWAGSGAPQTQTPLLESQDRLSPNHLAARSPSPHSEANIL